MEPTRDVVVFIFVQLAVRFLYIPPLEEFEAVDVFYQVYWFTGTSLLLRLFSSYLVYLIFWF